MILPYIWIILMTLLLSLIFKKRFEIIVPLSMIIGTFFLFFTGFLGNIKLGYYLTWVSFLFIPYLLFKQKGNHKTIWKNYFTFGFIIFTGVYVFLTIFHRFTAFETWDEFQHWGPMIKETMRWNQFYSIPESTLQTHKDYPPFVTLLQVLWCYLANGYTEAFCYRAMSIFSFSLFLPCFSKFDFKKTVHWILAILCVGLFVMINIVDYAWFFSLFETIYTDYFLGLFAAYTLFLCFNKKSNYEFFDYFNLSVTLTTLLMVKQMGIAFYAMALFVLAMQYGYDLLIIKNKFDKKKTVSMILAFVIIPFLVNRSWPLYIAQFNPDIQFSLSQISISSFFDLIFNGIGESWQIITLQNFTDAIFHRSLIESPFTLTYWPINIIISLTVFALNYFLFKQERFHSILLSMAHFIGVVGYALTMLLLYVFSFGPTEGPILASFERYINTYIYFGFSLILFVIISGVCKIHLKKSIIFLVSCCLALSTMIGENWNILTIENKYSGYASDPHYIELFHLIENKIEDGSNFLLISQYQDQTVHILKYLYPTIKFNVISVGEKKYSDDPYSINFTLEQWQDYLAQYDYAFTYNTDDELYTKYWLPITEEVLLNNRLYRIKKNDVCLIAVDNLCD